MNRIEQMKSYFCNYSRDEASEIMLIAEEMFSELPNLNGRVDREAIYRCALKKYQDSKK